MRKRLALIVCVMLTGCLALEAQTYKTVPAPVMNWYKDMITMFVQLAKDLSGAKAAPAVAKAFNDAAKFINDKQLNKRRADLKTQFEDFFTQDHDSTWVPSADWIKVSTDFGKSMQDYANFMQSVMKYANDTAVMQSMQNFQTSLSDLDSND